MQKQTKEIINLLIKALKEGFDDFHGLYLYGSFANETNQKDDDMEVVAIFDFEDKHKRELIWPIVGKIETDKDVYIDLHPVTIDSFKNDEEFYNEVINEGIFFDIDGIKK